MRPVAIRNTGLVTSVGLSAPASCAAFRARISNPVETRFRDARGNWIMAHQVALDTPWRGGTRLVKMAALALAECMDGIAQAEWEDIPLFLCVAEAERPGRAEDPGRELLAGVQRELAVRFGRHATVAAGRAGVAAALAQARAVLETGTAARALIVAVDSFLDWPTLHWYDSRERLLHPTNPNGFMPGEAAGALLVAPPTGQAGELVCTGIGFGQEGAAIGSERPLRADGLVQAVKGALAEAGLQLHHFDYRITDNSGEQYYFKEAALLLTRLLRVRKEEFDIWHPAECTGEIGAASGVSLIASAKAACDKRYGKGPNILVHCGNDGGARAALALQYRVAS